MQLLFIIKEDSCLFNMFLYSIRDKKTKVFNKPLFFIFLQLFKTVCDYLIALLFLITVTNANNDKLATITNGAIIVESPVLTLVDVDG